MGLKLVPASVFDGKDIWEMLKEFPKNDNGFYNPAYKIPFQKFKGMLNDKMDEALGLNLGPGMVPQSIYWLYNNDRPVGVSKLRVKLNKNLRYVEGGNIGYGIRPSERGNGYGSHILKLTLDKAKAKGLDMALITCYENNKGSRRVIEKNGGRLEKIENGECFYWIML